MQHGLHNLTLKVVVRTLVTAIIHEGTLIVCPHFRENLEVDSNYTWETHCRNGRSRSLSELQRNVQWKTIRVEIFCCVLLSNENIRGMFTYTEVCMVVKFTVEIA